MTALNVQRAIAAVFVVLGGWALMMPQQVIDLTIRPGIAQGSRLETLAVACFGAQALISGLFTATARFTRTTFLAYGIALVPFFAFNYWFYFVDPVFTTVGLLDLVGNAIMLALCAWGWKLSGPAVPPA
ncbi:hypothetical protein G7076_00885 [Sphingomonas sp. HDW15A]|uniref:hypothetical protein n=1 Tax=Sphingomonas sp. HDW15A TaxID=2714942 RepID=UPI0014095E7E|nr:hypothetical protein [Sphingomonas sp. HDW15A]QIK95235.1 hypothetical protein G7076_00885 [Sphingomonas sp. HDW15A]